MKTIVLAALALGLALTAAPAVAQQAGESMQSGPYISAAEAASHRGGIRERRAAYWRHHHRRHYRHHRAR